ncbi:MAG TPA: hypothetical protein VG935_03940 [Patescibacteria group bacterium]|nr:hypothetical protein [Patescibacteria group bacterium]
MKKLLILQSGLLLVGTVFSWYTVTNDYLRFLTIHGTNPLLTPCFYGAIGFFVAFLFSLHIYLSSEEKRKKHQKYLMFFLIGGTIFGWSNFALEFCKFYFLHNPTSCSGTSTSSPFLTACFYGSVIYLLSLTASIITYRKTNPHSFKK